MQSMQCSQYKYGVHVLNAGTNVLCAEDTCSMQATPTKNPNHATLGELSAPLLWPR